MVESSGDDSLVAARAVVSRTTRVFYVSFNTTLPTTATVAASYPAVLTGGPTQRVPGPHGESNGRGGTTGPRAGVIVPSPTIASSEQDGEGSTNILVEYAAIIAGIAIGIILLVGLIVFSQSVIAVGQAEMVRSAVMLESRPERRCPYRKVVSLLNHFDFVWCNLICFVDFIW